MSIISKIKSAISKIIRKPTPTIQYDKPIRPQQQKVIKKSSLVDKPVYYNPKTYEPITPSSRGGGSRPSTQAGKTLQQLAVTTPSKSQQVTQVSGRQSQQQRIQEQLKQAQAYKVYQGTKTDLTPKVDVNVYPSGTIYSSQTGTTTYKGKDIPILKYYTIPEDSYSSREATQEEIKQLKEYQQSEKTKELFYTKPRTKIENIIGEQKGKAQAFFSEPFGSEEGRQNIITGFGNIGSKLGSRTAGEFTGGAIANIIAPRTKGEIAESGLMVLLGGGLGAGTKGVSYGLSKIPKVGSLLSKGFKLGTYGAGAYLTGAYAVDTAGRISKVKEPSEKGYITGGAIKNLFFLGEGYKAGSKAGSQAIGLLKTRGRTEISLERLTTEEVLSGAENFPLAPKSKQLNLFITTTKRYPELAEGKAGGFHTTPEIFWKKEIKPKAGTSELAGLYTSAYVSPYFAKLGGKGYSIIPTIKSITSGEEPAIAFLKPAGFRIVKSTPTKPYKIEEQIFKYKFTKPAKKGFMDLPLMKTEIEAVARPEAGTYIFESGKYYTTINGVKVPIDVFGFPDYSKVSKANQNKIFSSEGYYYPSQTKAVIEPTSSLGTINYNVPLTSKPSTTSILNTNYPASKPSTTSGKSSGRTSSKTSSSKSSSSSIISKVSSISPLSSAPSSKASYKTSNILSMKSGSSSKSSRKSTSMPSRYPQRYNKQTSTTGIIGVPSTSAKRSLLNKLSKKQLFFTWIKEKGKEIIIKKALTKAEAIKLGEKITRGELSATFGIIPSGKFIETSKEEREYNPSSAFFRTFRIKKGKKIPLINTWIQRRSKRLSSKSEVSLIQKAKKSKIKKMRWL